ncbi:cytochrome P450, partial [Amylostereum chailletii]
MTLLPLPYLQHPCIEWLTLTAWGKKHVMVNVFGKKTCIINSAEVASELLASGGSAKKYSERPNFVMVKELMGWDFNLGFMNLSNPTYLEHRQNFVQALSPKNSDAYMPIQTHETILLLQRLLESPARFEEHIKSSIGSVMMRTAFGYQPTENDPLVRIAEEAMHVMVKAGRPGAHLVDVLPILKYVPEWFPGAQFKRVAREGYKLAQELQNGAWSWATDQYEKGTAKESVFTFLMDKVARGADVKRVKEDCALLYATGTDTIASSVLTFVLAMLHAPEVQRRAQEELDRVTGKGRLPTFEDSADLPYITAIAKESLRWESVTPLGLPHALKEDDIYAGYFIPAGTTVLANQWAMSHNESVYPDPMSFKPERFLHGEKVREPNTIAFGWGRRICPGRFLAENR